MKMKSISFSKKLLVVLPILIAVALMSVFSVMIIKKQNKCINNQEVEVTTYEYLPLTIENGEIKAYNGARDGSASFEIPAAYDIDDVAGDTYQIKSIAENAFKDVKFNCLIVNLDNMQSIGASAFENAENVYLKGGSQGYLIGDYAFKNSIVGFSKLFLLASESEQESTVGVDAFANSKQFDIRSVSSNLFATDEQIVNGEVTTTATNGIITFGGYYNSSAVSSINLAGFNGVVTIKSSDGHGAFEGATNLSTASFGSNTVIIEQNAFKNSGLTTFSYRGDISSIGDSAFEGSDLSSLSLSATTIKNIGNRTFYGCESLEQINLPRNLQVIGESTFRECYALESLTIPSNVTNIGQYAFSASGLTSITLPSTVSTIQQYAFYSCASLETIYVERETPATLGTNVFNNLPANFVIYVPEGTSATYKSATNWSTYYRYIKELVASSPNIVVTYTTASGKSPSEIDASEMTVLSYSTFTDNIDNFDKTTVKEVFIPGTITVIDDGTFHSFTSLTSVTISEGVTKIGLNDDLLMIEFGDALNSLLPFGGCTSLTSITIPDSVTYISPGAFGRCAALSSVEFGSGLKSIPKYAFYYCQSLTSIEIPETIFSIGNTAFQNAALSSVVFDDPNGWIVNGANLNSSDLENTSTAATFLTTDYYSYSWAKLVSYNGLYYQITSDSTVTVYGFAGSSEKPTGDISIPSSVTLSGVPYTVNEVGQSAFDGCSEITSVIIPSSVLEIRTKAFNDCSNLSSVTLNEGLLTIWSTAFANTNITEITIPSTVLGIGKSAFSGTALTSATFEDKVGWKVTSSSSSSTPSVSNASNAATGLKTTYIDYAWTKAFIVDGVVYMLNDGAALIGYLSFSRIIVQGKQGDVKSTGDIELVSSITLSGKYYKVDTTIPDNAFSNCTGLTSVIISGNFTSIGRSAFSGCTNLTSVTFRSNTIETICYAAFQNCSSLESITIPNSVTTMGSSPNSNAVYTAGSIFSGCSSLNSVTLPENIGVIYDSTFYNCTSLTEIVIPDNVITISTQAFNGCTSLSEATFNKTVAWLAGTTFLSSSNLENKTTAARYLTTDYVNSVFTRYLYSNGLYYNLLSGSNVEVYGCIGDSPKAAGNVEIPDEVTIDGETYSVTQIGTNGFANCSGITSIVLPDTIRVIKTGAFTGIESIMTPDGNGKYFGTSDNAYFALVYSTIQTDGTLTLNQKTKILGEDALGGAFSTNGDYYLYGSGATLSVEFNLSAASGHTITLTPNLTETKLPANTVLPAELKITIGTSCLAYDTPILLADGTYKMIQDVQYTDQIVQFNHDTGKVEVTYAFWLHNPKYTDGYVKYSFSDGSYINVVGPHAVFNTDLNEYVEFSDRSKLNIGSHVLKTVYQNGQFVMTTVTVTNIEYMNEEIAYFVVNTPLYINCFASGILTSDALVIPLQNMYGFDENYRYASETRQQYLDGEYDGFLISEDYAKGELGMTDIDFVACRAEEWGMLLENGILAPDDLSARIDNNVNAEDDRRLPLTNEQGNVIWAVTTDLDGIGIDTSDYMFEEGSVYVLPENDAENFIGWRSSFDGKIYQAGDEYTVICSTHFRAVFAN